MWNFITKHHQELLLVTNCFVAIGTIGAVFVGIFGNSIRNFFIRPKIKVDFRFDDPIDKEENKSNSFNKSHERKYCIKILNEGRAIATNCQLVIDELYKQRRDGNAWVCEKRFFSSSLLWLNNVSVLNIGQNMSSYVQFLSIEDDLDKSDDRGNNIIPMQRDENVRMALCLANNKCSLSSGTYILEVKTYADNIYPISNYFEIFLDPSCNWKNLNLQKCFKLTLLNKKEFEKRIGG